MIKASKTTRMTLYKTIQKTKIITKTTTSSKIRDRGKAIRAKRWAETTGHKTTLTSSTMTRTKIRTTRKSKTKRETKKQPRRTRRFRSLRLYKRKESRCAKTSLIFSKRQKLGLYQPTTVPMPHPKNL